MADKSNDPPPKAERTDSDAPKPQSKDEPIIVSRRQFNDFALI